MLEGFLGKGCSRAKDGVGNDLVNCSGHDDINPSGIVMEEFSYRRDHKVKKVFGGIYKEELQDNRVCLLYGGYEVHSNFTIRFF